MNICLLTQANPRNWTPFLLSAFKQRGHVLTVGPAWTGVNAAGERVTLENDITAGLDHVANLYDVLPSGWQPDLVVAISGGGVPLLTNTGNLGCPTVFYSVDTWQCIMDHPEARNYDLVFTAQREFVPLLHATGSARVEWLPLACDPAAHHPVEAAATHDVAFVGGLSLPVHAQRVSLLRLIARHMDLTAKEGLFGDAMCTHFATGKLAFNHAAVQDVNMRIFEALAMGRPLLTNRDSAPNGLLDLFEEDRHLVVYDGGKDLVEKALALVADEPRRGQIAEEGRRHVLSAHTYLHRVDTLLDAVRQAFPDFEGADSGPRALTADIMTHLPRIPGVTIDAGMAAGKSKYAARRLGVTKYIGLSADADLVAARVGSYDKVDAWPGDKRESTAETVVIADPAVLGSDLPSVLGAARRLLIPGGTLIARIPGGEEASDLAGLFQALHLPLINVHPLNDSGTIVTARKRGRSVRDVVLESYVKIKPPGVAIDQLVAAIPDAL